MYIDSFREIVTSSTLNIPQRLKRIDSKYFIVRNHQTQQWEIHYKGQIGGTFCLNLSYDELDERTLRRVKETSIEYIDKIMMEMEKKNKSIETTGDKKIKNATEFAAKEVYRYLNKHESKEIIDKDSKYFKDVV